MTERTKTDLDACRCEAAAGPVLSGWGRAAILAATGSFCVVLIMTPWRAPVWPAALLLVLLLLAVALVARSVAATPSGFVCLLLNATFLVCIAHLVLYPEALSGTALVLALLPVTMRINRMLLSGLDPICANMTLFRLSSAPVLLFLVGPAADGEWTDLKTVTIALMCAGLTELLVGASCRQAVAARATVTGGPRARQTATADLTFALDKAASPDITAKAPSVAPDGARGGVSVDMSVASAGGLAGTAQHSWQPEMARVNRLLLLVAVSVTMAHEISQPLNAAAIFIGATQRCLDQPQPHVREAHCAATNAAAQLERARAIMTRIRGCAGGNDEAPVCLDVNEAIVAVVELMQPACAARGVPERFHPGHSRVVRVTAIRCELEQVIANLLLNSLQAIAATEREGGVRFAVRVGADSVTVWVFDDGEGLPAVPAEHLFERFMTTKPHGTGLGLPISRQLAEKAGGRLTLHCRRRRAGAVAMLRLPATTSL